MIQVLTCSLISMAVVLPPGIERLIGFLPLFASLTSLPLQILIETQADARFDAHTEVA